MIRRIQKIMLELEYILYICLLSCMCGPIKINIDDCGHLLLRWCVIASFEKKPIKL